MKISFSRIVLAIAIATIVMLSGAFQEGEANEITFDFTGTVTFITGSLGSEVFNPTQTLSGSYTFESGTADIDPADPRDGLYPGALTALTVSIDSYTATLGVGSVIGIFDGSTFDEYSVLAGPSGPSVAGLDPTLFLITLIDGTGSALSSDALPLTPPDLSDFQSHTWALFFERENTIGFVDGNITSLTQVPEPGMLFLLGSGLAGLGGVALRRRKK